MFSVYHYFYLGLLFLWEWMNSIDLHFCKVDCGGVVSTCCVLCKGTAMILRHNAVYTKMHTIYLSIYLSIFHIYIIYISNKHIHDQNLVSKHVVQVDILLTYPHKTHTQQQNNIQWYIPTHTPHTHIYLLPTNLPVENVLELCLLTK